MTAKQRSLGMPADAIPATYPSNDSEPKPVRVLPTSMSAPFCELRGDRVWIGHRLGDTRHAETSFTRAELQALAPQLRAAFAAIKETP